MQLKGATSRSTVVRPRAGNQMGHAARVSHPRRGVAAAGVWLWIGCMLIPALLLRGEPWVLQPTGVDDISLKATDFLTRYVLLCPCPAVGYIMISHRACLQHAICATALQPLSPPLAHSTHTRVGGWVG